MNRNEWRSGLFSLVAMACALVFPLRAYAALVVSGPALGVPGGTLSLDIGLDAALAANIDELSLVVQFDSDVLIGQNAVAGPLLAIGSFGANAPAGSATHSFLTTLSSLGPGVVATWNFVIDPAALSQTTVVQATLKTFLIDNELTANLVSEPLTIQVQAVPLPAALPLLGSAFLALSALARRRAASCAGCVAATETYHFSEPFRRPLMPVLTT